MPDVTKYFPARTLRRGFTLVEMVIVMAIIIVILAIAVPVWNALVGNSGLAAAQNQISAALANARADAMYYRQTIGVFFFIDPVSGQTAMAEVQYTPDVVTSSVNQSTADSLEMVFTYDPSTIPAQLVYYRDVILLPAGVGVALNNNDTFGGSVNVGLDRYVRTGAILFGSDGTLTSQAYAVAQKITLPYGTSPTATSQLATRLGLTATSSPNVLVSTTTVGNIALTSQVGLLLYDENVYMNQKAGGTDSEGTGDDAPFTEADLEYLLPGQTAPSSDIDKSLEEQWLDQNGIGILITPFNGAMVKAK